MDMPSYRERAEAIFAVFAKRLETLPIAVPEMLRVLMLHSLPVLQVCSISELSCFVSCLVFVTFFLGGGAEYCIHVCVQLRLATRLW